MRIDVVSIFPGYLAPLELSLVGKARDKGLLDLQIHDLRSWTHDRHRTVDDTPYGGGAGMVMRPEPWGDALDTLLQTAGAAARPPRLLVMTPSGHRFSQAAAESLSREDRLIFACGRYEGIDQRVIDHYAERIPVDEVSVGDFVLSGGEVAAMTVIEAVVRLIPGFMGNPESLAEESHHTGAGGGLLEYPVFTKPPRWRGLDVPDVLLSGHHSQIAEWRLDQALRRTSQRRPDLLHPSETVSAADLAGADDRQGQSAVELRRAVAGDAPELLTLQRACWVGEAQVNDALFLPALTESLVEVRDDLSTWVTWVLRASGRLVGSVRGRLEPGVDAGRWEIGRLMVAPDLLGRGFGRLLLEHAERTAPEHARSFSLVTGAKSLDNLRRYRRSGYRLSQEPFVDETGQPDPGVVRLTKARPLAP